MASKKRNKGQAAHESPAEDKGAAVPSPAERAESLGLDPAPWPTSEDVAAARAEGAPWLEELGRPDIDETEGQDPDGLGAESPARPPAGAWRDEHGAWQHPPMEAGDNGAAELPASPRADHVVDSARYALGMDPGREDAGPTLEPVPASPTHELTHDPDPRLRESAAIVEARYEAMREPPRPEGEAHHMGGPLYWFETRGERGEGFTRGVHTVELPPGPWRGFQAIALDSEDNLVLAGHVVTHHRGQSAQVHVQGASGWAPVIALVLVRDERAHVQPEAQR